MIFKYKLLLYLIFAFCISLSWGQTNIPPNIIAFGDQGYCPLSQINIVTSFDIIDPDDKEIQSLSIQVSTGYVQGEDRLLLTGIHPSIDSFWNDSEGKLRLSGFGGLDIPYSDLIAAVNNVVFQSSSANVNGDKYFSFTIGDANYLPSTDHYYEYISAPGITWSQAKAAAEARTYFGLQGYLVTITSPEEAQLSGEQAAGTGWIGANDAETEGVWKWVTGPEAGSTFWFGEGNGTTNGADFPYANWNSLNDEPNNAKSGTEHYAHIVSPNLVPLGQANLGTWNDLPNVGSTGNFFPQGYIVEYGGMPGDPIVNIAASTKLLVPIITNIIGAEICGENSVTLEATASIGDVIWYDALNGGNQVHLGSTFITPSLTQDTHYYALASADGCLEGERTQVTAIIKPSPTILSNVTFKNCDEDGLPDGFTDFNLNEVNDIITSEALTDVNITFYLSSLKAESGTSEITASPFNNQTSNIVYARVEFIDYGCYSISTINLEVSTTSFPLGYVNNDLQLCDIDDEVDGITEFDLSSVSQTFINFFPSGQNLSVHYYSDFIDAQLEEKEITNITNYENKTPFSEILYVRVESNDNGDCFGIGPHLQLTVHPIPEFEVEEPDVFCLGGSSVELRTFNPKGNYTYEWQDTEGNIISSATTAIVNSAGTCTVVATSAFNCSSFPVSVTVEESSISDINIDDIVIMDLINNNTVNLDITDIGIGDYEFSLDNEFGPFQNNTFFEDISPGDYTLYVRDKNGCGTLPLELSVLGFPRFFTPNGDSFNPTWNIIGMTSDRYTQNSTVFIYDRYGKLLKQIPINSDGWDGTFNGKPLPNSDYWFVAELMTNDDKIRVLRGHFSLIR